jgi:hypothetical protein
LLVMIVLPLRLCDESSFGWGGGGAVLLPCCVSGFRCFGVSVLRGVGVSGP